MVILVSELLVWTGPTEALLNSSLSSSCTILEEIVTMKSVISPGDLGLGRGRDQVRVTDLESNPVTRGREGGSGGAEEKLNFIKTYLKE